MLDNETKKRIDDCRDILVGKLPDPKSQIEQITIALIYKFMNDMDKEAVELGGKAKFFSGEFEKYSWDNLFNPKISAHQMLKLYAEAIESMEKNPNIPQLFRDIFKNAYLPYRDPETLKLFLKTIGEFEYTHSEKLGDAFEYLLSVMGSQGDAGQFRTPRHIIDFIVKAVDPSKTDTILDPACGTAGFLISAYKHILKKNKDQLTPAERKRLIKNFVGYDISPDMVRLSLVNMYLHGFSDPHIFEYDTLTSEDRWNETFDVILANPPFMTPKGGIRPHKRFSIQSKRSEVLFVDYIAEHLNPGGKAGIIVPEGIIFQSGKAYKELRKMLVENYLYAVVSLPAGVFNPYSGVKTSILLLDREIARKTDKILFVKIENDGFSLGARRTPVKGGQLEEAVEIIKNYKLKIKNEEEVSALAADTRLAHVVEKSKIAENGEYNLSGERYKFNEKLKITNYKLVELKEIAEVIRGITFSKKDQLSSTAANTIKVVTTKAAQEYGIVDKNVYFISKDKIKDKRKLLQNGDILISTANSLRLLGRTTFVKNINGEYSFGAFMSLIRAYKSKVLPLFLFHVLRSERIRKYFYANARTTTNISNLSFLILNSTKIPLPPLSVQEEIVKEIEGYQKIIDGAKQVVENYKPRIEIDPDWEMVELGEVCENITSGFAFGKSNKLKEKSDILHIRPMNITTTGYFTLKGSKYLPLDVYEKNIKKTVKVGDVLFNNTNSKELVGKTCIIDKEIKAGFSNHITRIRVKREILEPKYLSIYLHNLWETGYFLKKCHKWVGQAGINIKELSVTKVPLPPLEVQKQIVAKIEEERKLVEANKKLIEIFEQKIKDRIAKVWGEK